MTKYETVIGLEVHIELATSTKIFCACDTSFGGEPNTKVCPVCMGLPGSLPVLNKKVLEMAVKLGLATNCKISGESVFDRKNYDYPDNPQNYQISQLYAPICQDGYIDIDVSDNKTISTDKLTQKLINGKKRIRIREMHMEEDAGKLIHDTESNTSLVNFNRSGVPLIEIVTQPDLGNGDEAVEFLKKLRDIAKYLEISDCKMQEGSMRVDVNLSVRPEGSSEMGTRTEMKNLNSFRAVKRAVESEAKRQMEILEAGDDVKLETRRWDEDQDCSFAMRNKEKYSDYRYFPDPDLPKIHMSQDTIDRIRSGLPELREEKINRYMESFGLSEYDASLITEAVNLTRIFEETTRLSGKPKRVANWLMVEAKRIANEQGLDQEEIRINPEYLSILINMIDEGKINGNVAKQVFQEILLNDAEPGQYVKEHNLATINDMDMIEHVIEEVLIDNDKIVKEYLEGKEKVLGFLVGQAMKALGGKADAKLLREKIVEIISSSK